MIIRLLSIYKKTLAPVLLILLFLPLAGIAQPEGYKPVSDPDLLSRKINEASAGVNTINASFIQEKNISFIEEKIISNGILLYQKPDKLRLEYKEPFTYIMIMNGGRMMTDNGEKKSEYDLKSNKMFSEINNLIISSVKGDILNSKSFDSFLFENDENVFIRLIPLDNELTKYIKTIDLYLSKKDYTVSDLNIREQSDDFTWIRFTNKILNESLSDGSFAL
jgi:outer membrane lipoprotein-sorting protein